MKRLSVLAVILVLVGGAYLLGRRSSSSVSGSPPEVAAASVYQCPMHPWIKADRADAKCTVCGMLSSLVHILIVTPVIFAWLEERRLLRG